MTRRQKKQINKVLRMLDKSFDAVNTLKEWEVESCSIYTEYGNFSFEIFVRLKNMQDVSRTRSGTVKKYIAL